MATSFTAVFGMKTFVDFVCIPGGMSYHLGEVGIVILPKSRKVGRSCVAIQDTAQILGRCENGLGRDHYGLIGVCGTKQRHNICHLNHFKCPVQ